MDNKVNLVWHSVPKETPENSPLFGFIADKSESELLQRTLELLELPANTPYEALGYQFKGTFNRRTWTRRHILGVSIFILERSKRAMPPRRTDLANFIGVGTIDSHIAPLIKKLPQQIREAMYIDQARSRAGKIAAEKQKERRKQRIKINA